MADQSMFDVAATALVPARKMSHAAVQWASRAARANLPALADDSHSSLTWQGAHHALVSQCLDGAQRLQLGFSFATGNLIWLEDGNVVDGLPLVSEDEARAWCDAHLAASSLAPTGHAQMPYELDPVDYSTIADEAAALATLGAWFGATQQLLETLVAEHGDEAVSPPMVRCWPHHFDLATLFFLDGGDPETARSVGVGLSPGDDSYGEPYFYCTPWPKPAELPEASENFAWHTDGFTSLVCPASAIGVDTDLGHIADTAVRLAFQILED